MICFNKSQLYNFADDTTILEKANNTDDLLEILKEETASEETALRNNLVLLFWKEYDNLVKLSRNKRGMKIVCLKSYLAVTSVNITRYISFVTKFYFW